MLSHNSSPSALLLRLLDCVPAVLTSSDCGLFSQFCVPDRGMVGHTLLGKALSHSKERSLLGRSKYWVLPISPPLPIPAWERNASPSCQWPVWQSHCCLFHEPIFFACFKLPHRICCWICCDLSTMCCQQLWDRHKYFTGIKLAHSSVHVIRVQPELLLGLFSPRR